MSMLIRRFAFCEEDCMIWINAEGFTLCEVAVCDCRVVPEDIQNRKEMVIKWDRLIMW